MKKQTLMAMGVCLLILLCLGLAAWAYSLYQQSEMEKRYIARTNSYLVSETIDKAIRGKVMELGGDCNPNSNMAKTANGFKQHWFVMIPQQEEAAMDAYMNELQDNVKKFLTTVVDGDIISKPDICVQWEKIEGYASGNMKPYSITVVYEVMTFVPLNRSIR